MQENWMFNLITDYVMDPIFIIDQNRIPVFISPVFAEIFGIERDELMKMDLFKLIHHGDREHVEGKFEHLFLSQEAYHSEHRITDKEGATRYWECRTTPITKAGKRFALVTSRDVTDRKRIELELHEKKMRYEQLQRSLETFSKELSLVVQIAELEERLLKELTAVFPNCRPSIRVTNRELSDFGNGLKPGKLETVGNEAVIKIGFHENEVYILSLSAESIREEMDVTYLETLSHYVIMVFENMNAIGTLARQTELALQENERPQWMVRLLFHLQEQQRMELSSDLHDTVLQDQINLYRQLEDLLSKDGMQPETKKQLRWVEQGLLDSIHQIRITCNELRPPLLRELGLERALENLFEQTQVSSTFKIAFTSNRSRNYGLNEEQTIGVYRIVQELLHNAAKHSNASSLVFTLDSKEDQFVLEYYDDGIGFEATKLQPSFASMGLSGIRQRAQSLSGTIQFYSEPNGGVHAIMYIPMGAAIKQ